jgi:hypothetical protein
VPDKPWSLVNGQPWSPLFCFVFGLGYSNYSFNSMTISGALRGGAAPRGSLSVSVQVSDTSSHQSWWPPGSTVVQIYAAPLSASRTGQVRYKKTLVGFTKAAIATSGVTTVAVDIHAEELGYTVFHPMLSGAKNHPRLLESGQYRLLACMSECHCPLNSTITVQGE